MRSEHLSIGLQSVTVSSGLSVAAGCTAQLAELGQSRAHSLTGTAWSVGFSDKHLTPVHNMGSCEYFGFFHKI